MKDKLICWASGIFAVCIIFFAPIFLLFYVMIALVIFDFITKISAILKKYKGKNIVTKLLNVKSYLMKFTPIKAVFYCSFIGLTYAIEISVFGKSLFITNIIALLFFMTEIYSIAENLDFCFGNNIFVTAVKRIRKLFESKTAKIFTEETRKENESRH